MTQEYFISVYLDRRRSKANGKYPVKLRLFTSNPKTQKLYPTMFEFTEREFEQIWLSAKTRTQFKEIKRQMQAVEIKAIETAKEIKPFSIEQFERQLYRKKGDGISVKYHYNEVIQELLKRNQIGTAETYKLSEKSIVDFVTNEKKKKYEKLTFFDITSSWLKDYEHYFIEVKGRSSTTVSIYLRVLRVLFNKAIREKEIEKEFYPFGETKYQTPATKNVKKVLSKEQVKNLFSITPKTPEQEKAKDFWFLSYACNGMNFKDIALLKYKQIKGGKIEFVREKTKRTTLKNQKPITVFKNEFIEKIISKYGNSDIRDENFVFNIVCENLTPHQKQIKIKNFTRFVNQHLKKLCSENNLPPDISTYWARHSFATIAVRNGATMEFMQESLGHGNLKTTQSYFAGFDSETKKEFAKTIMNFD